MATTNPFEVVRELATMQNRMNRIWSNIYDRGAEYADVTSRGGWQPPVDIFENDARELVLRAELPGLRRDDIDITIENGTLTIKGERKQDEGVREDRYHRLERPYGHFSRSFTLPNTVDSSRVRAEYRDGVLTVVLPVRAEAQPRQIQVEVQE
jgi:HSP20 family protein